MTRLSDLSREIAQVVAGLAPSLVRVDARGGRPATGIIWADNLVLTADHVIEADDAILVTGAPTTVKASVVGRDRTTDLALLRTEGLRGAPAPRGRSADVRTGHIVLALGGTIGEQQVTMGVVSGSAGAFRSWRGGQVMPLIQTTAQLLPGFSGGPLIDGEGRVIGINSWNFGRGVSCALPVEIAERVAESLRTHGRIRQAYLGVGVQPVRLSETLGLGQDAGLLVVTVEPDGPADKAGLLQGDTLVTMDGDPLFGRLDGFFAMVRGLDVDSTHAFGVVRAGEVRDVAVTLGEVPG
ncbi:MAG TPA: trypsin-like peptidase domain-containing protein [Candidatus Dormibacteraeota bacterium]|nr:trypsin-like peptidase domain-containing protein [Candidatus Dormibacteraeota bacterium]